MAVASSARANGRPPGTSTINFKRGDDSQIVAGMTFGVVVSSDGGATWRWMCEAAVGYGGLYDPDYAFAATGSLFATTFDGFRVRRDACVFAATPLATAFVSRTTLGPDGAVYATASDPMNGNIYKSTDDGVSFPISSMPGMLNDWLHSIEVAQSNANRVYLSGYRFQNGQPKLHLMFRSNDGAQSWTPLPVTAFATMENSAIEIVGISTTDPDLVFARVTSEDNLAAEAIYRSTDAGQTWTRVLGKPEPISFLVRGNGDLLAATKTAGTSRSTDNGTTWQDVAGAPHINCLAENGAGEVWACTQNFGMDPLPSDGAGIMKTADLVTWTKVLRYQDILGPVDCPAGTAQRDMCDAIWCGLCMQLGCDPMRECPSIGVDGPPDASSDTVKVPKSSGCCDARGSASGMLWFVVGLFVLRRRRRAAGSCALMLFLIAVLPSTVAYANGRAPVTNGVYFHPEDNQSIFVRTTFGLLISRDDGCSFRWVCEQNVGYGGTFDPKYAIAKDGTIFATTFTGLRVSRDGGCSFSTATAELPAGAPGRIADLWVDALDIGPTGEIWVATAESGKPNDIYSSTDNGVTFTSRGMQSPMIWWKSVEVAPSDPLRVYISGYQVVTPTDAASSPIAHVYATTDGGQNWTPASLAGVQYGFTPILIVAAVDPVNPLIVYVISVESNGKGDRLYRSSDGGVSFSEVLATPDPLNSVVVRNANTVIAASAMAGAYRSDDGGLTFAPVAGSPKLGCLGQRPDGTLIGCGANWDPDFMAAGKSSDGSQWQKIFRFVELAGPLACPAGTPEHDVCDQQLWPGMQQQFGATGPKEPACSVQLVDMPVDPPKSGGCCDASGSTPLGMLAAAAMLAFVVLRRRR